MSVTAGSGQIEAKEKQPGNIFKCMSLVKDAVFTSDQYKEYSGKTGLPKPDQHNRIKKFLWKSLYLRALSTHFLTISHNLEVLNIKKY